MHPITSILTVSLRIDKYGRYICDREERYCQSSGLDCVHTTYLNKMNGPAFGIRLLRPEPYNGKDLGMVIGFDVGTTYSGVSYAILRPGEVPEVISVSG